MNKLLILFKAHDVSSKTNYRNNLYDKLIKNHVKHTKDFENAKTFFLFADPDLSQEELIINQFIFFKMNENYHEALLHKIIKGMIFFIKNLEYTHLFTTNLSTCVNIKKILDLCDEKPVKSKIGFFDKSSLENHFQQKVDYCGKGYFFPSGAGCLYTRETVKLILNRFDIIIKDDGFKKKYPQADDVFMGKVLHELSIKIEELDRVDIQNANFLNDHKINKNNSHVRVKYLNNREDEIFAHQEIYNIFYN